MVLDPSEVARLARRNEAANLEFRRLLHRQPTLAAELPVIGAQVESTVDCTACAACCRQTRVDVGPPDLARIAAFLKLRPADVQRLYTEDGAGLLLAQPDGVCVFLHHNLCLIYEVRPETCRRFPYLTPRASSLGSRLASIWSHAWFCPIVFNTIEELKRRAGFRPHAAR